MTISLIAAAVLVTGICGLLIAAIVAVVWVILKERQDRPS